MKEKLITFETAKLAKKKGFRYVTQGGTVGQIMRKVGVSYETKKSIYKVYVTQSLLQKWLREEYLLHIEIGFQHCTWWCSINKLPYASFIDSDLIGRTDFSSYEEALEKGLQEALKLI